MRTFALSTICLFAACGNSSSSDDASAGDLASAVGDLATSGDDLAVGGDDLAIPAGNCVSGTYRYCDDFESYNGAVTNGAKLGPWMAAVAGGVTMTVDSVKPHAGAKSLHIAVPTNTVKMAVHGTLAQKAATGLVPGNDLYGRAMVYYSSANGNGLPLNVHSWIFDATGTGTSADGGTGGTSINMGGGGAKMQLNYHWPGSTTEQSVTGGTITTDAWHCVQWQYDGAGHPPANIAKVWLDGTLVVNVPATNGWELATPWDAFAFGFTHYQTLANTVELFLDDFALDGKMVPCQ